MVIVSLKLRSGDKNLELVIQSGHVTDAEKFRTVRQLNNDKDLDFSQYTTFLELIKGRFPNVEIRSDQILIRGVKSLSNHEVDGPGSSALIVLNGAPSNFNVLSSLAPANIKSVKIVTGGSALMYGFGSGNGVVVIETKGFGD